MAKQPAGWARRAALALLALGGLAAQAAEPVTLAVSRAPLSLPVHVAQRQGFFADEGLEVRLVDCIGGHRCMQLMLDGQADVATVGELPVVFNAFKRQDYAVIATITTTADDVKLVVRGSAAGAAAPKELKDLTGKRVGAVIGTSSHYVLDLALLTSGVDPRGITMVPLQPEDMLAAMRAGRVDAVSIWEPFAYGLVAALPGAAALPSPGGYIGTFNLVAQRRLLMPRDAMLQHLLRAMDRAERFIQQNPVEAQRLLREQLQLDAKSVEWAWKGLTFRLGLDQSLITTMEGQARWARREGHASGEMPNFLGLVHAGPLRQAVPSAAGSLK